MKSDFKNVILKFISPVKKCTHGKVIHNSSKLKYDFMTPHIFMMNLGSFIHSLDYCMHAMNTSPLM